MTDIEIKPAAVNSLNRLEEKERQEVIEEIEVFEEEKFQHPDLRPIKDEDGNWIWRLKVKKKHTDHRVFIELEEGVFKVLNVLHRDVAYE